MLRPYPLLALSLAACNSAADHKAKADVAPSGVTSGAPAARVSGSSAPPEGPPAGAFEVVHDLEFEGKRLSHLRGAVVVCEGTCSYPKGKDKPPRVALVTGRDKPDTSLFPLAPYAKLQDHLVKRGGSFSYFGRHPDEVWVRLERGFLDSDNDRSNWSAGPDVPVVLRRDGDGWTDKGSRPQEAPWGPLTHEQKLALLDLHLKPFDAIVGSGGPALRVSDKSVERYVGDGWVALPLKWDHGEGVRLADGRTLLASGGAWLVGKGGEVEQLPGIEGAKYVAVLGGAAWLVTQGGGHTRLHGPKDTKAFAVREPIVRRDAGVAASIGFPAKRTEACKTPWVTLSTPPQLGWKYGSTTQALQGKAPQLQGEVTFVEYQEGTSIVFGAQCKTAKACDELAAVFEKETKAKTSSGCLDALAGIPEPDAPPPNARIVYLDLVSGYLL